MRKALYVYRPGDTRQVTKFLWFPLTLPVDKKDSRYRERRWLEKATVMQVLRDGRHCLYWDEAYYVE